MRNGNLTQKWIIMLKRKRLLGSTKKKPFSRSISIIKCHWSFGGSRANRLSPLLREWTDFDCLMDFQKFFTLSGVCRHVITRRAPHKNHQQSFSKRMRIVFQLKVSKWNVIELGDSDSKSFCCFASVDTLRLLHFKCWSRSSKKLAGWLAGWPQIASAPTRKLHLCAQLLIYFEPNSNNSITSKLSTRSQLVRLLRPHIDSSRQLCRVINQ